MKDIGGILKNAMSLHDLTQRDVAKILHISPQALNSYVNNRRRPNLDCFLQLIELLDLRCIFFDDSIENNPIQAYLYENIKKLKSEQKNLMILIVQYLNKMNQSLDSKAKN